MNAALRHLFPRLFKTRPARAFKRLPALLSTLLPALCISSARAQATAPAAQPAASAAAAGERIEITGARFREQAGKTSLSGKELALLPGASGDPMRALQSLPGVMSINDASSEPAVRGARPRDNAYYVDFLPVGYLFHVGGVTSVFNPSMIRRFSLASAAWSPEYGNVVGAVFDIELRAPRTDRLGGNADFSLLGGSVLVEGPITPDLSFFLAARRSWFDLAFKREEDEKEGISYTAPVYSDGQGRLLWNLGPSQRLRLDFSAAADRLKFDVKPGGKVAGREPILAGNVGEKQSYSTAAVVWESEHGDTLANRMALGRMQQDTSLRLAGAGTVKVGLDTAYLRQQLTLTRWAAHEVTLGTSVESRRIRADLDFNYPRCTEFDPNCDITTAPRLVTGQSARQNTAAVHLSDRWRFAPAWAATAGLRLSREAYIDRNAAEPRLALEWNPDAASTWSLALGRHSQPPNNEESLAVIGNPRLRPVRSDHVALGLTRRLAQGWSWRAEAYAKHFDGYAVADPVLNYRNGASGNAGGVELLVKKDPVSGTQFSGFASLTVSRARREVQGTGARFPFDYDQPVVGTVVLQYKRSEHWQYGAKWSYHTGSPYTPVVGRGLYPDGRVRPLYGTINSQRLPAYHRLDLRADRRFSERTQGYVELINAYNRKNVAGYDYNASYTQRDEVLQLPLLLSFGINYKF